MVETAYRADSRYVGACRRRSLEAAAKFSSKSSQIERLMHVSRVVYEFAGFKHLFA